MHTYIPHTHKILCVVNLNFRKSLTEIPRNGCRTMRAAAVTWQSPISPDGRLAELSCTAWPYARLLEHIGDYLYIYIYICIYYIFVHTGVRMAGRIGIHEGGQGA